MTNKYSDILNLVYELESSSGRDPKAYKENSVGALGGYQITRNAFKDLQSVFPKKWGRLNFDRIMVDDNYGREAAKDFLGIIGTRLIKKGVAPTRDALLMGYHSGVGNVVKGKIGPQGRQYLQRANELVGLSPER